ncbi:Uncharacterised protein [Paenibacillus macerans]|uniref:Uncharacterized protein n=1 Tax=Paenibacillus macerans TaxID=44252 RepID=A0A091A2C7_PAEMA|nr:hypothetical protein DJ90_744 [Paenibacillus macerans]SUD26161.1 Uncharacterised protein [Paenibacillus macerans]
MPPVLLLLMFIIGIHQILKVSIQAIEPLVPYMTIGIQPFVHFLKRLRPQLINPAIRVCLHIHDSCIKKHAEMLGYLRLPQLKAIGYSPDSKGAFTQ